MGQEVTPQSQGSVPPPGHPQAILQGPSGSWDPVDRPLGESRATELWSPVCQRGSEARSPALCPGGGPDSWRERGLKGLCWAFCLPGLSLKVRRRPLQRVDSAWTCTPGPQEPAYPGHLSHLGPARQGKQAPGQVTK